MVSICFIVQNDTVDPLEALSHKCRRPFQSDNTRKHPVSLERITEEYLLSSAVNLNVLLLPLIHSAPKHLNIAYHDVPYHPHLPCNGTWNAPIPACSTKTNRALPPSNAGKGNAFMNASSSTNVARLCKVWDSDYHLRGFSGNWYSTKVETKLRLIVTSPSERSNNRPNDELTNDKWW